MCLYLFVRIFFRKLYDEIRYQEEYIRAEVRARWKGEDSELRKIKHRKKRTEKEHISLEK